MTLIASLIGIISLIFNAKGNPLGQAMMVVFSILYGIISFTFRYFGEMVTYLGMTAPMALFALISWMRHPYKGNNDIILIVLWSLAAAENIAYVSVLICFAMFLINDLYGFISWRRMEKRQGEGNVPFCEGM